METEYSSHMCVNESSSVHSNINWRDVQRKNVVNNVDMSSLRAPWQIGPYTEKHIEHHDATDSQKKLFFSGFLYIFYIYLKFIVIEVDLSLTITS